MNIGFNISLLFEIIVSEIILLNKVEMIYNEHIYLYKVI